MFFKKYISNIRPFVDGGDLLKNKNDITITNQILKDINYEFNKFITQKNIIITELKDYHKKLLEQLIQLSLPNLELLLSKHFSDTRQPILICQYCDNYK